MLRRGPGATVHSCRGERDLDAYEAKRDFETTPEPKGRKPQARRAIRFGAFRRPGTSRAVAALGSAPRT